ncbi:MAG TPA: hypothetical protein DCW90_02380 [Lachnospiraceae bacterium]|nr:hypothetical protein [Lachnospiraceae bacterium]
MAEIINGIFDKDGTLKENVTSRQIDAAYDKLMAATDIKADNTNINIDNPEDLKLSDEQAEEIAEYIEKNTDDSILQQAKEDAENSELEDEAKKASVAINPVTGTAMMADDFDPDDESIRSIEDLIMNDCGIDINDFDMDVFVSKYAIATFFAINTDALELNGITDDVVKEVNKVVDKFKDFKVTGKKFSFFNAMPQAIKDQIIKLLGTNQLTVTGNTTKEARNYASACLMNAIIEVNVGEAIQDDLNQSIAKMNKELSQDNMWGETRRYFSEDLNELIPKLEADGCTEQAERARAVQRSFVQSCTYEEMFNEIKMGKLKYRKIDMEDFDKTCKKFNAQYETSTNVITDVAQVWPALCRNDKIDGTTEIYKEFICLFIAYCKKHNLDPNNIVQHTFMYYFIQNIVTLEFYNPDNEEDVKFHDDIVANIQRVINYLSQKDFDSIQEG